VAHHRSLRSQLYGTARVLGDLEAVSHGPGSYAKRYVRRKVYARSNSFSHSILRALNLSK